MSADSSTSQTVTTLRDSAYTTPRRNVFAMVPSAARYILDVGCSNGALGRSLMTAQPGRSVCGIEFDTAFARESAQTDVSQGALQIHGTGAKATGEKTHQLKAFAQYIPTDISSPGIDPIYIFTPIMAPTKHTLC